jgi:hypothetical protein
MATMSQGFRANPGLELANTFGVKITPHRDVSVALGRVALGANFAAVIS